MKKKLVFLSIMLSLSFATSAQEHVFFSGFFPEVAVTKKLQNGNKLNFKVENQQVFFRNVSNREERWDYSHYRTDLMLFHNWGISPLSNVALGAFYRIQDGNNAARFIQQFAFLDRFRKFRVGHRFRTDQTFESGEALEVRFRYRIAIDIPLNGSVVDVGESYVVLSNEPIFSLQGSEVELENRLVFTLGKLISKDKKIEYSIDYRTDGYVQEGFRTRLWAKLGFFYSL